jgi:CysZ protein
MFASVVRAFRLLFDPGFASIALRSALLSLLLFLIGLAACEFLVASLPVLGNPTVNRALELLTPVLFVFLLSALGAPVAAFFGTFFLDRVANRIEARDYPNPPALPARFWPGMKAGLRLSGMVLGADVLLLPLDIGVPGLGQILSLFVNGWLLGWEYFELAALRHLSLREADALRKSHGWQIWCGGVLIAFLSEIPLLDLIAPLFGTALMVHLFHRIRPETKRA